MNDEPPAKAGGFSHVIGRKTDRGHGLAVWHDDASFCPVVCRRDDISALRLGVGAVRMQQQTGKDQYLDTEVLTG